MTFTFRAGAAADLPGMYRLDLLCFDPPFRFDLETMAHFTSEPGAIVVVAEQDAELAGFIIVNVTRRKEVSSGYVTTLDVHPQYRRQGLAARLLQNAEANALAGNLACLVLHVFTGNQAAIAFYEGAGFERSVPAAVQGFYGEGLNAWVYVKNLIPYCP